MLSMQGGTLERKITEGASTDLRLLFRAPEGTARIACLFGVLDMRDGVGRVAPLRIRTPDGTINGAATPGQTGGSFTVRAGALGSHGPNPDFVVLNANLDAGGFFGGRSFELLSGDLTIGAGSTVTANNVSVSVDAGALNVAGTVNAIAALNDAKAMP